MTAPRLPLLIEPSDLEQHLGEDELLIVGLCPGDVYAQAHLPGAVHLDYGRIVRHEPPIMGLLPEAEQLSTLFSKLGLSNSTHVVAYDNEGGGMASRLLWTLDAIGHSSYSLLNGGLIAWAGEGYPLQAGPVIPLPSEYHAALNEAVIAGQTEILARLDDPSLCLLDARSPAEFRGLDIRAEHGGHIPGAHNLEWTRTFDPGNHCRLRPDSELLSMLETCAATPDKDVITYCHSHHRSALLYIVLKHLGYPSVKGYPGSWSDWGNAADTPVECP